MENPINDTVFDSRDLIEYKESLESDIYDAYVEWVENHNEFSDGDELEIPDSFEEIEYINEEAFTSTCEDLIEEYEKVKDFCDDLSGYGDFEYGEAIIHESYFTEYTEELVKDCGYIPNKIPSWICIDWEETADNVKEDYTEVDFDGETYLMRA